MRLLFVAIFLQICLVTGVQSNSRMQRISGSLEDAGIANGRTYFSLKNTDTGKLQHIICSREIVQELAQALQASEGKSIHVHTKVKSIQLGSPLLECANRPIYRSLEAERNYARSFGDKYVSGQILDADPDSGLLTIQSANKKTYLKIDPNLARKIQENLNSMQIQNIDGKFRFDRNRGFFVGSENAFRGQ